MLADLSCPEPGCDRTAVLVDTFTLDSTAGPVLHATTSCEASHHLTVPVG